jgi:S1-C subfamily serine protease
MGNTMSEYDPRDYPASPNPYDMETRRRRGSSLAEPVSPSPLAYSVLLLLGILLGMVGLWLGNRIVSRWAGEPPSHDPTAHPRETAPAAPLDCEEREAVTIFENAKDSVVNVDVVMIRQMRWDQPPIETQTSGGSGFVWDQHGRIVTNFHVIADVLRRPDLMTLRVVMADRSAYSATLIGAAPDHDLAVIQISAPKDKLKPIVVGTSHDLKVGQKAYAIGNPFGLSLTMTKGMISSLNRIIEAPSGARIPRVIQTDAAINPGNSGGPLLDKTGRLIGVNTSIATPNGGNVGIGFAVPVDTVNRVVTELIQTGRSLRPDLGITLFDERRLRQARYETGVMIERVLPNRAAAKAGLRGMKFNARGIPIEPGDLIIAINGEPVNDIEDYERIVRDLKVGEPAKVKVIRGNAELEVTVIVEGV